MPSNSPPLHPVFLRSECDSEGYTRAQVVSHVAHAEHLTDIRNGPIKVLFLCPDPRSSSHIGMPTKTLGPLSGNSSDKSPCPSPHAKVISRHFFPFSSQKAAMMGQYRALFAFMGWKPAWPLSPVSSASKYLLVNGLTVFLWPC